jgi:hypothetical protein
MNTHKKGDLAVMTTILEISKIGGHVAFPLHQHLHYDLIAELDGKCYRIQVKHGAPKNNPKKIQVSLKTVYQRKDKNYIRNREENDYDILAAFHPILNQVKFKKADQLGKTSVTIDFNEESKSFK